MAINAQELQGQWNNLRGRVKERWGQLTDDDLQIQGGNVDQLVGRIQQRTGEGRESIEKFLNDLTARDLQSRTSQWMLGKSADNFGPIGPYLVTADQVPDPNELKLECRVNGEVRQSSNTADMVFDCKALVSYISRHFTLRPGDIIFTGTPEGVIAGYPKDKQVWLKPGDKVTSMIEKLGTQEITLG